MIRMLEIKTGSAIWDIDGTILRFNRLKKIGDEEVKKQIIRYKTILQEGCYRKNPKELIRIASLLGEIILLKIGVEAYQKDFFQMFDYYCERYMEEWKESEQCMISNKISVFPALFFMFRGKIVGAGACNLASLRGLSCGGQKFQDIFREKVRLFWTKEISSIVEKNEDLQAIKDKIGIMLVTECFMGLSEEQVDSYLKEAAKSFTKKRIIITVQSYYRSIIGNDINMNRTRYFQPFVEKADKFVDMEYQIQCRKFVLDNTDEIHSGKDIWKVFYMHGPTLFYQTIDFTLLRCHSIRQEVKSYMRCRLIENQAKGDKSIYSVSEAVNYLTEHNPSIHYFTDISEIDAKALYMKMEKTCGNKNGKAVSEIMRSFSSLSLIFDYLMGPRREEGLKTPVPRENPFSKFRFHNVKGYKIRTSVIPECVMEQMEEHLEELDETQILIYRIFSQTGMRMKEVLFLEEDCMEETHYERLVQIKYKPYKTIKARRKKGVSDYHRVFIYQELADDIRREIENRKEWRREINLPYIFVNKRPGFRAGMLNMGNYLTIMNKLIERHGICDDNGELWHLTSKQQRKTLAVTLIENGGTVEELAYWLGHLSRNTAAGYYAEVRQMKLAELNTQFFKDKFDLLLSKEQLEEYSEEERRLLYMDFRLEQRRVELGFCTKKLAEGGCNSRNSIYNCVNCRNLCTGKKYLPYWQELLESQKKTVEAMEEGYASVGLEAYQNFKEYEWAVFLKRCYENMVECIKAGEWQ